MRSLIGVLLVFTALSINASVKQLRCEVTKDAANCLATLTNCKETRDFIFDTNDFAKERPEADTILVGTNQDKNKFLVDLEASSKWGYNVTTYYQILGVGNTYRTNFEVTPSFLTFMYVNNPECRSSVGRGYGTGNPNVTDLCELFTKPKSINISRKTLKGQNDKVDPPEKYSCELSDYDTSEYLL